MMMAHKVCKWGAWDQLSFSICAYKFSDTPINCAHIYMYVCMYSIYYNRHENQYHKLDRPILYLINFINDQN